MTTQKAESIVARSLIRWPDRYETERPIVLAIWASAALAAAGFAVLGDIAFDAIRRPIDPDEMSIVGVFLSFLFALPTLGFLLTGFCLWKLKTIGVPLGMFVGGLVALGTGGLAFGALADHELIGSMFAAVCIVSVRLLIDLARCVSAIRIVRGGGDRVGRGRGFEVLTPPDR